MLGQVMSGQKRRHRFRKRARLESARGWLSAPGVVGTIRAYRKRYGVDGYTAYAELTELGVPADRLPGHWAVRPEPVPRRKASDRRPALEADFASMFVSYGGQLTFVVDYTPGGVPLGPTWEELRDCDVFRRFRELFDEPDGDDAGPRLALKPEQLPRGEHRGTGRPPGNRWTK